MKSEKLYWKADKLDEEIISLLRVLGEEYPIIEGSSSEGKELIFERSESVGYLEVTSSSNAFTIQYGDQAQAARGVGVALSGTNEKSESSFTTLGIMLDCSRNAVMKVDHLKGWMRRLALMGYNMVMLYTEDTYQLPDEPYFGFQRGAYSMEEIKELDSYAASLGIELIGCIQVLGHMEKVLRWPAYQSIRDTSNVMLVDHEETYQLIEKMLAFWKEALRTRRLHIGMDETHGLGTGRFKETFGEENPSDIYSRHLKRVCALCQKEGLEPMIWSDMIFHLSGGQRGENDVQEEILKAAKKNVPEEMSLVHWDYYHEEIEDYRDLLDKHRKVGHEPLMASGVWTWSRLWYDHEQTVATVNPCIEACRETGVKELFFTMWGDGGSFCEFDSAMAGLMYSSNLCYGSPTGEEDLLVRFNAICHDDYDAFLIASGIQGKGPGYYREAQDDSPLKIQAPAILFEDPLYGLNFDKLDEESGYWDKVLKRYKEIKVSLEGVRDSESIIHARNLVESLLGAIEVKRELRQAHQSKSKEDLKKIRSELLPTVLKAFGRLTQTMRSQWMRRNKPEGFERIQNKLNQVVGRYEEAARAIDDVLCGNTPSLPGLR